MEPRITWYGHDSFGFQANGVQIYIDPWNMPTHVPKANIICITHEHHDHASLPDVTALRTPDTVVFASPSGHAVIPESKIINVGETKQIGDITIEAVPAYNPLKKFHPNDGTRVGFIITIGETRIYHAGDTDIIPELESYKPDIALLPVSGTYVMTAEEAAEAVAILKPKRVIPMHYDSIIGTRADAERFAGLVKNLTQVTILEKDK